MLHVGGGVTVGMMAAHTRFWGMCRPKGVAREMTVEAIVEALLRGDTPADNSSLYAALQDIAPPQLCKLTLAMLAANNRSLNVVRADLEQLKADVGTVRSAPATYLARLGTYVLNGLAMAVALMLAKMWGLI